MLLFHVYYIRATIFRSYVNDCHLESKLCTTNLGNNDQDKLAKFQLLKCFDILPVSNILYYYNIKHCLRLGF